MIRIFLCLAGIAYADISAGDSSHGRATAILAVRGSRLFPLTCFRGGSLHTTPDCANLIPSGASVRLSDGTVVKIEPAAFSCGGEVDPWPGGFRFSEDTPHAPVSWAVWPAQAENAAQPISDPKRYLAGLVAREFVRRQGTPVAVLSLDGEQRQLLIERRRKGEPVTWSVAIGPLWHPIPGPPPMVYGSLNCD